MIEKNLIKCYYFCAFFIPVWQLMRAYTLSLLAKLSPDGSPIVESEIVSWANERLSDKGVSIRHFKVNIFVP